MEKQFVKNAEKFTQELDAKKEEQFSASSLLQEVAPLLDDYFVGQFECKENAICLTFLNGQRFLLKAEVA